MELRSTSASGPHATAREPEARKDSVAPISSIEAGADVRAAKTPDGWSYPFKFSKLREKDPDPTLNKTVEYLIDSDDDFIVYLDEDHYVEWNMNSNDLLGPNTGQYLNMVGYLEAVDTTYLGHERTKTYRRIIAEGVARLFQKDLPAAKDAFDFAGKWVNARNTEIARRWYLVGSGSAAAISALAVLGLGYWNVAVSAKFNPQVYSILMGTAVGGLGAWLSVIQRNRSIELDIAAGPLLHHLEGAFRIMVGTLGAFLVALAIQAGLIAKVETLAALMVICMVAGVSERLVPSFIEQIESRAAAADKKKDTPQPLAGGH